MGVHLDGTARHQSVGQIDEPWLHSLLLAVGKKTGLAALINTSFNTKGKPIVNTVHESLKMLREIPDLDYVLIEDWLFRSPRLSIHAEYLRAVSAALRPDLFNSHRAKRRFSSF